MKRNRLLIGSAYLDPRLVSTEEETRSLIREGKLFVLVSCSMHASEVGATQLSPEAVYRLAPSFASMPTSVVVLYPKSGLLRSGWLQGESYLANKIGAAETRLGKGRIVLLPLRVQNRAQTHGTFKLLFNAILTAAVE